MMSQCCAIIVNILEQPARKDGIFNIYEESRIHGLRACGFDATARKKIYIYIYEDIALFYIGKWP